jgi:membrane protein YdbS with pleckstrin-like domain
LLSTAARIVAPPTRPGRAQYSMRISGSQHGATFLFFPMNSPPRPLLPSLGIHGLGPHADLPKLPALRWVWAMLAFGPCLLLAGVGLAVSWKTGMWQWAGLAAATLTGGGVWSGYWAGRRFEHHVARWVEGEGLVVEHGVWWRSQTWVPQSRIQHLDVAQGPLDRLWGMARLEVHTAGQHDHRAVVHGLPLAQALALRSALMPQPERAEGSA